MPVVAFLGLVRADAPILECHPARGTCTFRITYRYSRSWMEMTETDLLYVRMEAGPWLGERELRADLAKRGTGDHLSSMIRGLEDPLAFSSRADAEAAFVAAFGHPPSRAVVWQRPHPYPVLPATPLLEGRTEACVKEVLSLVTGRAAKVREDICFEESSP